MASRAGRAKVTKMWLTAVLEKCMKKKRRNPYRKCRNKKINRLTYTNF